MTNYAGKFLCSDWTRCSSIQWLSVLLTWHLCNGLLQHELPHYSQQDMPVTSFSCLEKTVGIYYADHETQCQMFHICVKVPGLGLQDFKFLCPNYTLFDQESQICDDWYNIDCEAAYSYHNENFDLYRIGVVREDKQSTNNPQARLLSGPASEFRRTTSKKITPSYNENNNYIDNESLKGSDSSNFFENNIDKQRYANSKDDFNEYKKVTNANEKNYAPVTDRSKSKLRQPSKLIINKQLINNNNDYEAANNNQFNSQQQETSTTVAKTDYPSTPFKNQQQNPSNDLSQFKNQRNPPNSERSPSKLKNHQANSLNNDQVVPSQLKNHQANPLNNDQTSPLLRNQVNPANDDFPAAQYRNQANPPSPPQQQHQHQYQHQHHQHQHQHQHHQRKYSTESRPTTVVADNTIFGEPNRDEETYSDKYSANGNVAPTTYSGDEQNRRNPSRTGLTSNAAPFQQQTSTHYVPLSTPSAFVTRRVNDNSNNKQWTADQQSGQKWEQPLSTFAFTDEHNSNPYIIKATTVSNEFLPSSIDDRYNGDVVNLNNRQPQQQTPQKPLAKDNSAPFSGEILKTAQSTNIKSASINKLIPDLYFSTTSAAPSSVLNTTLKNYLNFDKTPNGKSAPAPGKLSYQVGSDLIIKVLSGANAKSESGKSENPTEQNQKPPTKQKNDYDYAYYDDSPNDYELTEKSVTQDFGRISNTNA